MLAVAQRVDNHLGVQHGRGDNIDYVNLRVLDQLLKIRAGGLVAIAVLEGGRPLLVDIADGFQAHIDAAHLLGQPLILRQLLFFY